MSENGGDLIISDEMEIESGTRIEQVEEEQEDSLMWGTTENTMLTEDTIKASVVYRNLERQLTLSRNNEKANSDYANGLEDENSRLEAELVAERKKCTDLQENVTKLENELSDTKDELEKVKADKETYEAKLQHIAKIAGNPTVDISDNEFEKKQVLKRPKLLVKIKTPAPSVLEPTEEQAFLLNCRCGEHYGGRANLRRHLSSVVLDEDGIKKCFKCLSLYELSEIKQIFAKSKTAVKAEKLWNDAKKCAK